MKLLHQDDLRKQANINLIAPIFPSVLTSDLWIYFSLLIIVSRGYSCSHSKHWIINAEILFISGSVSPFILWWSFPEVNKCYLQPVVMSCSQRPCFPHFHVFQISVMQLRVKDLGGWTKVCRIKPKSFYETPTMHCFNQTIQYFKMKNADYIIYQSWSQQEIFTS